MISLFNPNSTACCFEAEREREKELNTVIILEHLGLDGMQVNAYTEELYKLLCVVPIEPIPLSYNDRCIKFQNFTLPPQPPIPVIL